MHPAPATVSSSCQFYLVCEVMKSQLHELVQKDSNRLLSLCLDIRSSVLMSFRKSIKSLHARKNDSSSAFKIFRLIESRLHFSIVLKHVSNRRRKGAGMQCHFVCKFLLMNNQNIRQISLHWNLKITSRYADTIRRRSCRRSF